MTASNNNRTVKLTAEQILRMALVVKHTKVAPPEPRLEKPITPEAP